jgi:HAD superfamily hydrolase (TIGR01509 family)
MLKALIFDVDGTLADTESTHRSAFNQAFAAFGLDWHWNEGVYNELLCVSGGKERIHHYWTTRHPELSAPLGLARSEAVHRLHALKTAAYESTVKAGMLPLRHGVLKLMTQARTEGLLLAIATTTSPPNIAALLRGALGADWRNHFSAIGDAETAPLKKPHPQVYLQILEALHCQPSECIAFEDSFNGLQASLAAGLATVITPTRYTANDNFSGAMRVLPDLRHADLASLRIWHAEYLASQAPALT